MADKYNNKVPQSIRSDIDGLEAGVNAALATIDTTAARFAADQVKGPQLRQMGESVRKGYSLLIKYVNDFYALLSSSESDKRTIGDLREQIEAKEKEVAGLGRKVQDLGKEKTELSGKIQTLTQEKTELQEQYTALQAKYSGKGKEAKAYEGEAGSLERKLISSSRRIKERDNAIERLELKIKGVSYGIRDARRQYRENVNYARRLLVDYFSYSEKVAGKMKPDVVYRTLEAEVVKTKDRMQSQDQALGLFEAIAGAKAPSQSTGAGAKALEKHLVGKDKTRKKPKRPDHKRSKDSGRKATKK